MSFPIEPCPVCKHNAELYPTASRVTNVKCHYCGDFNITNEATDSARYLDEAQRFTLSVTIRNRTEKLRPGSMPILVDTHLVDDTTQVDAIERINSISVPEKLDIALHWIANKSKFPGNGVQFKRDFVAPAFFAKNGDECTYLLNALEELKFVNVVRYQQGLQDFDVVVTVLHAGWGRIASRALGGLTSNMAFVAMWFDPQMDSAWMAIDKGVRACGYEPKRVDSEPHVSRIDQKIIADIRASKFVVADVTGQRPGVYYEAGFANGLNRPVIWTCRSDERDKIHFDTRQFHHLFWDTPDDLAEQVETFVMGLLGPGALKQR